MSGTPFCKYVYLEITEPSPALQGTAQIKTTAVSVVSEISAASAVVTGEAKGETGQEARDNARFETKACGRHGPTLSDEAKGR